VKAAFIKRAAFYFTTRQKNKDMEGLMSIADPHRKRNPRYKKITVKMPNGDKWKLHFPVNLRREHILFLHTLLDRPDFENGVLTPMLETFPDLTRWEFYKIVGIYQLIVDVQNQEGDTPITL